MKQIAVIETIGSITKIEKLSSVENNILLNTKVLRNTNPFPGFNTSGNEFSQIDAKFASIYIMLHYRYAPEKVIKLNALFKPQLQLECNAGYGEITMDGKIYPCIRIKGLKYISVIGKLQDFIKFHGFKLMQYNSFPCEGIIKVFKTFKLMEIENNVYRDYYEREKFYLHLQVDLNLEMFTRLYEKVKDKLPFNNFDAVIGEIYRFNGPQKIIRVFDKDKSLERAIRLKNIFVEEVKKEMIFG